MTNSNLVKTITRLERQNVDLQKNLMNTGENDNLRANYSSLELRLKAVEEQLEQERKENNFSDSDVLTKKQTWKIRPQSSNLILGRSGNTNTVVSNCSCCDAYADIAKDMSQLQDSILDFLRVAFLHHCLNSFPFVLQSSLFNPFLNCCLHCPSLVCIFRAVSRSCPRTSHTLARGGKNCPTFLS